MNNKRSSGAQCVEQCSTMLTRPATLPLRFELFNTECDASCSTPNVMPSRFLCGVTGLIQRGGGGQGLADVIVKKAKTRKMTMIVCFACGIAIFFDSAHLQLVHHGRASARTHLLSSCVVKCTHMCCTIAALRSLQRSANCCGDYLLTSHTQVVEITLSQSCSVRQQSHYRHNVQACSCASRRACTSCIYVQASVRGIAQLGFCH